MLQTCLASYLMVHCVNFLLIAEFLHLGQVRLWNQERMVGLVCCWETLKTLCLFNASEWEACPDK